MEKVHFGLEDDLIDPCWDNVFKAMFAKDTEESRVALSKLISALIEREISVVNVIANEPTINSLTDRQIRYDINGKFNDGELCNIEMTMYPDDSEPLRAEYHASRLNAGQEIRGSDKSYGDLKRVYQISILVNGSVINQDDFVHDFEFYDKKRNVSLNGIMHIITLELSKIRKILQKSVAEMNSQERWSVFFRYARDRKKREMINEILMAEEGIALAGQVLLGISRNEAERVRLESEHKNALDFQSKIVDANRKGRLEGRDEGLKEGRDEGLKEGQEMKAYRAAERLLKKGFEEADIADAVELPLSKILEIKEKMI